MSCNESNDRFSDGMLLFGMLGLLLLMRALTVGGSAWIWLGAFSVLFLGVAFYGIVSSFSTPVREDDEVE